MILMKRLQGNEFHAVKDELVPIGYSKTHRGNICVYYKGGFKHYLNELEKKTFDPKSLKEWYKQ